MEFEKKWFSKFKEQEKKFRQNLYEASPPNDEVDAYGKEDKADLIKIIQGVGVVDSSEIPHMEGDKVVWHVTVVDKKQHPIKVIFQNDVAEGVYISTDSYLFNNDSLVLIRQIVAYAHEWKSKWNVRMEQFN